MKNIKERIYAAIGSFGVGLSSFIVMHKGCDVTTQTAFLFILGAYIAFNTTVNNIIDMEDK